MRKCMCKLHKTLALLMTVAMLITCLPSQFVSVTGAAGTVPAVYSETENFELPGGYSVIAGSNSKQKLLQVDGQTKWELTNYSNAFNLTGYPAGFVETVNGNTFFSTGMLTNSRKDQFLYNFANTFTDTTVTYECRLRRPANGITMLVLADRRMSNFYSLDPAKWMAEFYLYSTNGNLTYQSEYTGPSTAVSTTAAYKTPTIGDWVYIRCVVILISNRNTINDPIPTSY